MENKLTTLHRNSAWRGISVLGAIITALLVLAFTLSIPFTRAGAAPLPPVPLCGDGSAPDYGFTYDLQQQHWTVNWQDYVSEQAVTEVDTVLDRLDRDSIAQTMILFESADHVGNRVNCAVHFLRYMKLGLPEGDRKDNGFVFLIVVESTRIDVHYGVGLGLPALTAPELTALNRDAEASYQSTQNMDRALLTLVEGFDRVSRNKYAPLIASASTPAAATVPLAPAGLPGILPICGLLCLGIFFLGFLLWVLRLLARAGIDFGSLGSGSWGSGPSFGGGGGGPWMRGGGGGGGAGGGPTMRGGGGSGRSGRGN